MEHIFLLFLFRKDFCLNPWPDQGYYESGNWKSQTSFMLTTVIYED